MPDYIVVAVRKDKKDNIKYVKITNDLFNYKFDFISKKELINLLDRGKSIMTAFLENENYYRRSAIVFSYIDKDGNKQIRTKANEIIKDNLDELPSL